MNTGIPSLQTQPRSNSVFNTMKAIFPIVVFAILVFLGGSRARVYAQQAGAGDAVLAADQGTPAIKGYVVGTADVAAYACPDTAKCPIKVTLKPGTVVLIIDNVVGSTVPGLNDNAWRKIVYQGMTLYVPMRYISVNAPGSQPSAGTGPDIALVQTSYEDDSTAAPGYPNGGSTSSTSSSSSFSTAPASGGTTAYPVPPLCDRLDPPTCYGILGPGGVYYYCPLADIFSNGACCPKGYTYGSGTCSRTLTITKEGGLVTWYAATDGRIDGNAGDRIAIYCRRTGRIEVWSINNSLGHFLVSFSHSAVDVAGRAGFSVAVGAQGLVTIGGDGHGQYWAAIHGGPYNATGAGDFAKIFHCYVA